VHNILVENGLTRFYELQSSPGLRIASAQPADRWVFLDKPDVRQRLLDFSDGRTCRVTFHVPAIHCVACVWLLENLFRLHPGIGRSQVNYPRREVSVVFQEEKIRVSELVALLASIGYEPRLTLGALEKAPPDPTRKRLWLRTGVAGFAFGNIMLLSIPQYVGLDSFSGPLFRAVFGVLSLVLAAPVVVYSASDYWRSAALSLRQRVLTLDVPIALGLAALYTRSAFEILSGRGEGYLDSLAGLVFFLLCGRVFQQKTHDRIAFDLDFRSFFPLSVTRITPDGEERTALSELRLGDRLVLRNGELIPADGTLVKGVALIDYSFVTGESEAVPKREGELLYAGGRQIGGAIEMEMTRPVSQGYLTSLWNDKAFAKDREMNPRTLTNLFSRWFTPAVILIAAAAGLLWWVHGDAARGLTAFTSVLIVACPCALALAAPFALGTAQRLLARRHVFLKNPLVLERLERINAIVFDKTGTLTAGCGGAVRFHDVSRGELSRREKGAVLSVARHSIHPHARRICEALESESGLDAPAVAAEGFEETPGRGLKGTIGGEAILIGSKTWLEEQRVPMPAMDLPHGSAVFLAIRGQFRGVFTLESGLRANASGLLKNVARRYELALLSGDNELDRARFEALFPPDEARLLFNQSPQAKLAFIRSMQESGRTVMMVGDGLNDAGALQQSDVGVAVVEQAGAFCPASDIILEAAQVEHLDRILAVGRGSARIVRLCFAISVLYNLAGIGVAAAGLLSPVIAAILMPMSSVTVVLFACAAAKRAVAGTWGTR
jgi:Cu+-exporting ATPase